MTSERISLILRSDRALLEQALVRVIGHLRQASIAPALRLQAARVSDGARDEVAIDIFKDERAGAAPPHGTAAGPRQESDRPAEASGQGLSLIVARRICSLLGGTLTSHPAMPAGAGFQVKLPLSV